MPKSCNYNGSESFARAQALSLTGPIFSGSEYDSGDNNKNNIMVLVSVLFGNSTLIAELFSSCRYCSHQNDCL